MKHGKPFTLTPTRLDSFFNVSSGSNAKYDLDNLIDDNTKAQKQSTKHKKNEVDK